MQILQSTTRNYINIPDEFINYAAAASLYVTRSWPANDPISDLPSANARGPEMANAIAVYTNLCSKTLSFRFTRQGTWNLTEDPSLPLQSQDVLNEQSALPPPGTVNQFQGYRYIDNGATGNGTNFSAITSFRKVNSTNEWDVLQRPSNTSLIIGYPNSPVGIMEVNYAFDVSNLNAVTRFAVTSAYFDDFIGLSINGQFMYCWNGAVIRDNKQQVATKMELLSNGTVDLGAGGTYPAVTGYLYFSQSYNFDLRPYLRQGTNTIRFQHINGRGAGDGHLAIDLVESAGGPPLNQSLSPDAPGYSAVISGNASYSALVNLLNNLASKLYSYMVNNVYLINYCHTNCHNNCHSSRGRR